MLAAAPPVQFSPPVVVTRSARATGEAPTVAINARGDTLLAWGAGRRAHLYVRRGAKTQTFAETYVFGAALALANDGSAAALFERDGAHGKRMIEVATAGAGARFRRPQRRLRLRCRRRRSCRSRRR